MMFRSKWSGIFSGAVVWGWLESSSLVCLAAEQGNEYLKYQEPQYSSPSMASTIAYVLSLIATFAIVLALAYWTSRFWGSKLGRLSQQNHLKVISSMSLTGKSGIYVVEILGQIYLLGVTDQQVTLLKEIESPEQIDLAQTLKTPMPNVNFEQVFRQQLTSLEHLSTKFPGVFGQRHQTKQSNEDEKR